MKKSLSLKDLQDLSSLMASKIRKPEEPNINHCRNANKIANLLNLNSKPRINNPNVLGLYKKINNKNSIKEKTEIENMNNSKKPILEDKPLSKAEGDLSLPIAQEKAKVEINITRVDNITRNNKKKRNSMISLNNNEANNSICLYKHNINNSYKNNNNNKKIIRKFSNIDISSVNISRQSSNISLINFELQNKNNIQISIAKKQENLPFNNINNNNNKLNEINIKDLNELLLANKDICEMNLSQRFSFRRSNSNKELLYFNLNNEFFNSLLDSKRNKTKNENLVNEEVRLREICDDEISENSFKVKHQKSLCLQPKKADEVNKNIKKLKINPNNYTSNINGYCPLVKKTEVIGNNRFNYYEYTDEYNKKVVFKSKVLYSSEMNNRENFDEEEILSFDKSTNFVKDLINYKWDNLNEYINKQEKLKKKETLKGDNPTASNLSFFSLFQNVVKDQILRKVDYEKMKKAFAIFVLTMLLQLIFSRK